MIKKINKEIIFICIIGILITIGTVIGFTHAAPDPVVINTAPNNTHTYTITVSYDARDKWGSDTLQGSRNVSASSNSIYIEDILPPDLIFEDFVRTDGETSIKARKRPGLNRTCYGTVVVGYPQINDENHYLGLTYNPDTRTISFRVFDLTAGCDIDIKYTATVPEVRDPITNLLLNEPRSYYNVVKAFSDGITTYSNYVNLRDYHGTVPTTYNVTYEYAGDVPYGAPQLPQTQTYPPNTKVAVMQEPQLNDYVFSGWTVGNNTSHAGDTFTITDSDVHFVGRFIPKTKYKVTYEIEGFQPATFAVPQEKSYEPGDSVTIKYDYHNDIYENNYAFTEWTSDDVEIIDDEDYHGFIMPDHDVVLKGTFARKKINVDVYYYPELPNDLYDDVVHNYKYTCGDPEPDLPELPSELTDRFTLLNWRKQNNEYRQGSFDATGLWPGHKNPCSDEVLTAYLVSNDYITDVEVFIDVLNPKEGYHTGEKIEYEITVKNGKVAADYIVLEKLIDSLNILPGDGYTVEDTNLIMIPHMNARSSLKIKAEMIMPDNNEFEILNTVRRKSASLPDNFILSDKNTEDTEGIKRGATLTVCNQVDHPLNDKVFQINIKGSDSFETWLNLKNSECQTIDVGIGGFSLYELEPQEYEVTNITGANTVSIPGAYVVLEPGNNKTVTFYNTLADTAFLHGYGSVENTIPSSEMPELQPARTTSIVFVSSYETNSSDQYMPDIKFIGNRSDYNVVEYYHNSIVDGIYEEPRNCSYANCPVPEGKTSDPYINHEYRFLGWSTEKQNQDLARGYNFNEANGKITFNNGLPTNLELEEGEVVYLYAIYDNYTDNRTCSIAEIKYHISDPTAEYDLFRFNPNVFTNKELLDYSGTINTVVYGHCSNDQSNNFRVVRGEYHEPEELYDFGYSEYFFWRYFTNPEHYDTYYSYQISEGYYNEYIEPVTPESTHYSEWQKFGVANISDINADIIRTGIYHNKYVDPNYLKIDVYADGYHPPTF